MLETLVNASASWYNKNIRSEVYHEEDKRIQISCIS